MSSLPLLLILLCLSMHACTARLLGHKETAGGVQVNLFITKGLAQDEEKVNKPHESLIPSGLRSSIFSEKLQTQGQEVRKDESKIHGSLVGAITIKQKNSKAFLKEVEAIKRAASGYKIAKSSQEKLPLETKTEGMKRQERSMLHDTEEALDSKENDTVEDIVVMDYAQPHRKPPIHNEKP